MARQNHEIASMIRAFTLALADLRHGTLLSIWLKSAALALALFIVAGFGLYWAIGYFDLIPESIGASWGEGIRDGLSAIVSFIAVILAAWVLFRGVIIALLGIFADDIVEFVEGRHYPFAAASGRRPGWALSLRLTMRSLGRLIGVNLLASPIYIAALFTGFGTAAAFLLVNGWLLGKDLDDVVQSRHVESRTVKPLPNLTRTALGLLGTVALSVPFVNLFVPILAVAMAVHISHQPKI